MYLLSVSLGIVPICAAIADAGVQRLHRLQQAFGLHWLIGARTLARPQ